MKKRAAPASVLSAAAMAVLTLAVFVRLKSVDSPENTVKRFHESLLARKDIQRYFVPFQVTRQANGFLQTMDVVMRASIDLEIGRAQRSQPNVSLVPVTYRLRPSQLSPSGGSTTFVWITTKTSNGWLIDIDATMAVGTQQSGGQLQ